MAEKKGVGRPPRWDNIEDLQKAIDKYFATTPENRITITGLALHLGFSERKSLIDYAEKEEYLHTIKKAKLRVENSYEIDLKERGNSGTIFALKNFNWKDKTEVEQINYNKDISIADLTDEEIKRFNDIIDAKHTTKES